MPLKLIKRGDRSVYPFKEMQVGDKLVFYLHEHPNVRSAASHCAQRTGMKFSVYEVKRGKHVVERIA